MEKELNIIKTSINLVPDGINPSPDYYCTWQTQLYATSDGKPEKQREIIGEKGLFGKEKPYGWAYFYEEARKDLFFVMDDSWDVSLSGDEGDYGSLVLHAQKFPEATKDAKNNEEALKRLSDKIKALGWKGLGGWVCAQESEKHGKGKTPEEYWTEKMKESENGGFSYWKVDWGKKGHDAAFRKMLVDIQRKISSSLIVEQAMTWEVIPYADTFRTYDVPAIMSIPMTMQKLSDIINLGLSGKCIINCEDEVYVAAAGGFSMGVMRHPYVGNFVNGKADMSFPAFHRNLKSKMHEVLRAVRWHRIAPAFGIGCTENKVSAEVLEDRWFIQNVADELEAWWLDVPAVRDSIKEGVLLKSAPAQIARNTSFALASADEEGRVPFIVTAKNPNGAISVATLGRTENRTYGIPRCDVSLDAQKNTPIGVFGEYKSLTLRGDFDGALAVLIQDLADSIAYDVTELVTVKRDAVILSGELISRIGTLTNPVGDTSEPAVVIEIVSIV